LNLKGKKKEPKPKENDIVYLRNQSNFNTGGIYEIFSGVYEFICLP